MTVEESVIYLASCVMNGELPDEELVSSMEPDKVLNFAKKHKISCLVAVALESAGIKDRETCKAISNAMRRNAIFENSLKEVKDKLEEAGIRYTPLKGIVLKEYYPDAFMREMADHDILIEASRAADVKKIMEEMGFTVKAYGTKHHDVYYKKPILNYEMHTSLFSSVFDPRLYEYYREKRDPFGREDMYLYLVAHEYKHYSKSGTGLRSLMDIYLYLKKNTMDWEYVENEAKKIGILEFERNNRQLAVSLFGENIVANEKMLANILSSGAYGTFAHRVENGINKSGGNRVNYVIKRLYVPMRITDPDYKKFAAEYPSFYKYKILLPLLPFYRFLIAVRTGKFKVEWGIICRAAASNTNKKDTY